MNKITANIINSLLAGALVLLGAFSTGDVTLEGFIIALAAAGLVAVTQFKDFWSEVMMSKTETNRRKKYDNTHRKPRVFNLLNI